MQLGRLRGDGWLYSHIVTYQSAAHDMSCLARRFILLDIDDTHTSSTDYSLQSAVYPIAVVS
jgi:hypothetical protein